MIYTVVNTPGPIDWAAKGDERYLRSIANIITAWRWECPYYPDLGLNPALIHAPHTKAEAMVIDEVHRNIAAYVPGVRVVEVRARQGEAGLEIEVDVEVVRA